MNGSQNIKQMKQTLRYLYILSFFVLLFAACSKQLDQQPPSNTTTDNFYTTTNDFIQAVNGGYTKLTAYPSQVLWLGEMRSDNLNAVSDGTRDWQGINDFSPNITTVAFVSQAWTNNFNGIYNVNATLDALQTKGNVVSDTALRTRLTAECHFLRAFYYFQLVRLFGQVPVIDKPLTAAEVGAVGRSAVSDVYTLIISDLEYAALHLPASYTSADLGRATSWAAKGILGLVYLTRSGPDNGINGPGLNSNEYDKALALFNEIITSNAYSFVEDYASIFSYTNENNAEVIFDVQFMSSSNGAGFPSHLVPVAYWTGQGISNSYGNGYGASNFGVSANLKASYDATGGTGTDIRKAFNLQLSYASPFIKKYIDYSRRGTSGTDWPINFIVLRYTDILLMKAECILHGAAGTQGEVDEIVNKVRNRAGLGPVTGITPDNLLEERRKEFVGEGLRWNDLVRSGKAVSIMNAWITSEGLSTISNVVPDYLIYPVPASEIAAKPGLYEQNQSYY
jgi:starch-binding outer membrane protein, SusD/RagB family